MFHYLDNARVAKSTNGLESFFGHLKGHLAVHRGLSIKHRKNFIQWYLYFKNPSRSEFLKAIKLGMILNGEGPLYESLLTIPVGNTIANKLIFSRACFLFRLTTDRKEILNQNAPTIFGKLPIISISPSRSGFCVKNLNTTSHT